MVLPGPGPAEKARLPDGADDDPPPPELTLALLPHVVHLGLSSWDFSSSLLRRRRSCCCETSS